MPALPVGGIDQFFEAERLEVFRIAGGEFPHTVIEQGVGQAGIKDGADRKEPRGKGAGGSQAADTARSGEWISSQCSEARRRVSARVHSLAAAKRFSSRYSASGN